MQRRENAPVIRETMYEHPSVRPLNPVEYELLRADEEIKRLHAVLDAQSLTLVQQRCLILVLLSSIDGNSQESLL